MKTSTAHLPKLSATEVTAMIQRGYVACGYPRKGVIVVNGFKRYAADKAAIDAAKQANAIKLAS